FSFAELSVGLGLRRRRFGDRGTDSVRISAEFWRQNFPEQPEQTGGNQHEVDPFENLVGAFLRGAATLFGGVNAHHDEQQRKKHAQKNVKPAAHHWASLAGLLGGRCGGIWRTRRATSAESCAMVAS